MMLDDLFVDYGGMAMRALSPTWDLGTWLNAVGVQFLCGWQMVTVPGACQAGAMWMHPAGLGVYAPAGCACHGTPPTVFGRN